MKPYLTLILIVLASAALAEGPLTPPGSPAPTMKSLQEIWDKIGGLETQVTQTQAEIANVRADNLALSGLLAASNVSLPWLITTVDSIGDVGADPSLAFDRLGKPCVAYYDITNADLKYATLETNGWQVTTVDTTGNVGYAPSLAFGPDGRPSIAYQDVTGSRVKYMRHDGSAWQPTLVAESGASLPSLAFGPNGQPAIAYRLGTTARLARLDGTWSTQAVSVGIVTSRAVLAFDLRNGMPVVAYQFDANPGFPGSLGLMKSQLSNAGWNHSQVGTIDFHGYTPTMKAGPGASPSVAHFVAQHMNATAGLKFEGDYVVTSGQTTNPSIAFGVNGQPAVSYYQSDSEDLRIAMFNGAIWELSVVDADGSVGAANSLAFGPDGQPAIAYYDATNGDLKFARKGLFRPAP